MAAIYANRRPKSFFVNLPLASVTELFEAHLQRRAEIMTELGESACPVLPLEAYFARSQQADQDRRRHLEKKSALSYLLDLDLFAWRPKSEWMGKLGKKKTGAAQPRTRFNFQISRQPRPGE